MHFEKVNHLVGIAVCHRLLSTAALKLNDKVR